MTEPVSWVVGSGGLLGSSTAPALARLGPVWAPDRPVPWGQPGAAEVLADSARSFLAEAGARPWQVAWCAGAGVTGSTSQDLAEEADVFRHFLSVLESASAGNRDGALFLASSAGGVYAGSRGAPFTESTVPVPISPYGAAKIELENMSRQFSLSSEIPVLLGRISNLYGPNQNLNKPQGLISQICRAHLLRQPLSIYVPLDTLRDYIFAPDCGALVADALVRLRRETAESGPALHTKVLASQQGVTIGLLVAELRRIFKRAPRIVYGSSATSRFQVRDLRMRSQVWTELDRRSLTPLPAGIKQTVETLIRSLQAAGLS